MILAVAMGLATLASDSRTIIRKEQQDVGGAQTICLRIHVVDKESYDLLNVARLSAGGRAHRRNILSSLSLIMLCTYNARGLLIS